MEISFCDRCKESIPDPDFDSGRAVRVAGRNFHVACAFRRAFPGPGRRVAIVLAVLALAAATYAAVRAHQLDGRVESVRVRAADDSRSLEMLAKAGPGSPGAVREVVDARLAAARAEEQKAFDALAATIRSDLEKARQALRADTEKKLEDWEGANQQRFGNIENRLGDMADWIRDVRELAKRAAEAPPVAPISPPVAAAPPDTPSTAPVDPAEAKRRSADVDRNVALLKDPSDTIVFSAAMALGDLGDLRAVPPLVDTLKTHKYFYARLAAASSLGQMKAADAMPALIEALEDKDTLVQTAVAEAITAITNEPFKNPLGRSKKELKALKDEWAAWWKAHEAEVRARLNQPPS